MKPYNSNFEYICDIKELMDLKIDAYENGFGETGVALVTECRTKIKDRSALTKELFMPLEHIINVFRLNELEEHFFYTLFLYESDGGYKEKLLSVKLPGGIYPMSFEAMLLLVNQERLLANFSWLGFLDNLISYSDDGRFILKKEIMNFIFNPYEPVEKPWKEIYYPYMGDGGFIFEENAVFVISRLAKKYLEDTSGEGSIISVFGAPGSGRKSMVRYVGFKNGFPILFINCKMISNKNDFESIIDEIKTESILIGCVLCFCNINAVLSDAEKLSALLWGISPMSRLVFMTAEEKGLDFYDYKYTVAEYEALPPAAEIALRLWEKETAGCNMDNDIDLGRLVNVFKLTPLQIKQAVGAAYIKAVSAGMEEIGEEQLMQACRDVSTKNISALGKILQPVFKLEDLILLPEQKEILKNAIDRIRFYGTVYKEWGFEDTMPYGAGLKILMCGLPGTGKTMTAQVLAHELGMPVYKIDLSAVMSKYIGETEKSLNKVFEEGKNTNSILFFDEADALFGKRTEIKDSHDRHANLQVSFLLQKIEEHQGVVLLATNLAKNFDDAFKRRFHYILNIPMPDALHRRKIWERAFPHKTPVEGDVDFEYLSERFNLSGSNIKNIALSAAFYAVYQNKAVGMQEILKALKEELVKNGNVTLTEDFLEYE